MTRPFGMPSLVALACVAGLTLACFGSVASRDRQLAFRDFSDFYYPLYQKVQQEWDRGRLPLWSNGENCGTPLLGNPTAAVLYPGKLIYAVLPYPTAAKVYVVAHVLLAFGTMVILLKGWGVSPVGASLGGLAYAFGAPVLTQYSNVVFLVGASWMPLGFRFADAWIRSRDRRAIAGLAFVLAMQVLGGDPEAAYLTAFASAGFAMVTWAWGELPGRRFRVGLSLVALLAVYGAMLALEIAGISNTSASLGLWCVIGLVIIARKWSRRGRFSPEGGLLGLLGACLLALALSGAQLLPTLEFIAQSSRADSTVSVDIYGQSIHPARVIEWAWPNSFGATFGVNRNWLTALPPTNDHNVWMSSIYMGGLTILLAAGAVGLRDGPTGRGWMIGVAMLGVLGGFGDYASPVFLARVLPGGEARYGNLEAAEPPLPREDGRLRDGDGGVCWFLSSTLPGFRSFRYPGKLFIPAALAIAALAGIGFDGLLAGRRRVLWTLGSVWLGLSLAGLGWTFLRSDLILKFLEGRAEWARSAFGPFDPIGALADLRRGLIHGSIVAAATLILARLASKRPGLAGVLALAILTIDLALANRGQVGVVSQSAYESTPKTLSAILQSERDNPEAGPYRVFRLPSWALHRWSETSSTDRLEEFVRWERDTLRPKYEQPLGVESTFAYSTAELAEAREFFEPLRVVPNPSVARSVGIAPGAPIIYYPRRGFDLWNTRYFILPTRLAWNSSTRGFASLMPETSPIYPERFTGPDAKVRREEWGRNEDVQVFRNRAAYPRAWVVHRAIPVGPSTKLNVADRQTLMTRLLYQDDELWHLDDREPTDLRRVALVEATVDQLTGLAGGREGAEPVTILPTENPSKVELEVTLDSPGLVVLAEMFYPGWTLEIDGKPAEIHRTNRAMRGAIVPAGKHRLVYRYRPTSLKLGAIASLLGLVAWLTMLAQRASRRSTPSPSLEN